MRKPVLSAVLCLIMAACAGEEPSGPQSQPTEPASPSPTTTTVPEPECADLTGTPVAQILMRDFTFVPFCAIVSGDQRLEFVNEGNSRHSFTIPELDFDVLAGKTTTTKQAIGEVLKPGDTYAYQCKYHLGGSVPGPMNGELRVE
jgi:plastocyanin